jgi:hypothetical protein
MCCNASRSSCSISASIASCRARCCAAILRPCRPRQTAWILQPKLSSAVQTRSGAGFALAPAAFLPSFPPTALLPFFPPFAFFPPGSSFPLVPAPARAVPATADLLALALAGGFCPVTRW